MVMILGLSLLHQYIALCHVGLLAMLLHITARTTINFLAFSATCVMNMMLQFRIMLCSVSAGVLGCGCRLIIMITLTSFCFAKKITFVQYRNSNL